MSLKEPVSIQKMQPLIGMEISVRDTGIEYKSREPEGYINFVQYEDAKIIDIDEVQKKEKI